MPASRIAAAFLALCFAVFIALSFVSFTAHAEGDAADKQCKSGNTCGEKGGKKCDYTCNWPATPTKKIDGKEQEVQCMKNAPCLDSSASGLINVKGKCAAANVCAGKECRTPSGGYETCKKAEAQVPPSLTDGPVPPPTEPVKLPPPTGSGSLLQQALEGETPTPPPDTGAKVPEAISGSASPDPAAPTPTDEKKGGFWETLGKSLYEGYEGVKSALTPSSSPPPTTETMGSETGGLAGTPPATPQTTGFEPPPNAGPVPTEEPSLWERVKDAGPRVVAVAVGTIGDGVGKIVDIGSSFSRGLADSFFNTEIPASEDGASSDVGGRPPEVQTNPTFADIRNNVTAQEARLNELEGPRITADIANTVAQERLKAAAEAAGTKLDGTTYSAPTSKDPKTLGEFKAALANANATAAEVNRVSKDLQPVVNDYKAALSEYQKVVNDPAGGPLARAVMNAEAARDAATKVQTAWESGTAGLDVTRASPEDLSTSPPPDLPIAEKRLADTNRALNEYLSGNRSPELLQRIEDAKSGQGTFSSWADTITNPFKKDMAFNEAAIKSDWEQLKSGTLLSPLYAANIAVNGAWWLSDSLGIAVVDGAKVMGEAIGVPGFRDTPDGVLGAYANPDARSDQVIKAGTDLAMLAPYGRIASAIERTFFAVERDLGGAAATSPARGGLDLGDTVATNAVKTELAARDFGAGPYAHVADTPAGPVFAAEPLPPVAGAVTRAQSEAIEALSRTLTSADRAALAEVGLATKPYGTIQAEVTTQVGGRPVTETVNIQRTALVNAEGEVVAVQSRALGSGAVKVEPMAGYEIVAPVESRGVLGSLQDRYNRWFGGEAAPSAPAVEVPAAASGETRLLSGPTVEPPVPVGGSALPRVDSPSIVPSSAPSANPVVVTGATAQEIGPALKAGAETSPALAVQPIPTSSPPPVAIVELIPNGRWDPIALEEGAASAGPVVVELKPTTGGLESGRVVPDGVISPSSPTVAVAPVEAVTSPVSTKLPVSTWALSWLDSLFPVGSAAASPAPGAPSLEAPSVEAPATPSPAPAPTVAVAPDPGVSAPTPTPAPTISPPSVTTPAAPSTPSPSPSPATPVTPTAPVSPTAPSLPSVAEPAVAVPSSPAVSSPSPGIFFPSIPSPTSGSSAAYANPAPLLTPQQFKLPIPNFVTTSVPAPATEKELIAILESRGDIRITKPHDVQYPTDLRITGTENISGSDKRYIDALPLALGNFYTGYDFNDIFGDDVAARTKWQQAALKEFGDAFDELQSKSRLRLNIMSGVLGMFRGYVNALDKNGIRTPEADVVRQIYATLPTPDDLAYSRYNAMSPAEKADVIARFDSAAENFEAIASASLPENAPDANPAPTLVRTPFETALNFARAGVIAPLLLSPVSPFISGAEAKPVPVSTVQSGEPQSPSPTLVAKAGPISGAASTYNPNVPGYRTGGQGLATGGTYNPRAYEAALQLDLARQYGMGIPGKVGYALVQAGDRELILKINDNGPLVPGRIIDLNEASMRYLSNGRYGNNSGVLNNVTVTPLRGSQYATGPVVKKTTVASTPTPKPTPNTIAGAIERTLGALLKGAAIGSGAIPDPAAPAVKVSTPTRAITTTPATPTSMDKLVAKQNLFPQGVTVTPNANNVFTVQNSGVVLAYIEPVVPAKTVTYPPLNEATYTTAALRKIANETRNIGLGRVLRSIDVRDGRNVRPDAWIERTTLAAVIGGLQDFAKLHPNTTPIITETSDMGLRDYPSPHKRGTAVDFGVKNLTDAQVNDLRKAMNDHGLDTPYTLNHGTAPHLHVQLGTALPSDLANLTIKYTIPTQFAVFDPEGTQIGQTFAFSGPRYVAPDPRAVNNTPEKFTQLTGVTVPAAAATPLPLVSTWAPPAAANRAPLFTADTAPFGWSQQTVIAVAPQPPVVPTVVANTIPTPNLTRGVVLPSKPAGVPGVTSAAPEPPVPAPVTVAAAEPTPPPAPQPVAAEPTPVPPVPQQTVVAATPASSQMPTVVQYTFAHSVNAQSTPAPYTQVRFSPSALRRPDEPQVRPGAAGAQPATPPAPEPLPPAPTVEQAALARQEYLKDPVVATEAFKDFSRLPLKGLDAEIQEASIAKYLSDKQGLLDQYQAHFGEKVVNPDLAYLLFRPIGYVGTNVAAVQKASSALAQDVWRQALANNPEPSVYMLAGGSSAGKSSTVERLLPEFNSEAAAILDVTSANAKDTAEKVDEIIAAGKIPKGVYVSRNPEDAFDNGVISSLNGDSIDAGRIVTIPVFVGGFKDSLAVVRSLLDDPRVTVTLIDNSRGPGKAALMTREEFSKITYPEDLEERILQRTKDLLVAGTITLEQYAAITETPAPGDIALASEEPVVPIDIEVPAPTAAVPAEPLDATAFTGSQVEGQLTWLRNLRNNISDALGGLVTLTTKAWNAIPSAPEPTYQPLSPIPAGESLVVMPGRSESIWRTRSGPTVFVNNEGVGSTALPQPQLPVVAPTVSPSPFGEEAPRAASAPEQTPPSQIPHVLDAVRNPVTGVYEVAGHEGPIAMGGLKMGDTIVPETTAPVVDASGEVQGPPTKDFINYLYQKLFGQTAPQTGPILALPAPASAVPDWMKALETDIEQATAGINKAVREVFLGEQQIANDVTPAPVETATPAPEKIITLADEPQIEIPAAAPAPGRLITLADEPQIDSPTTRGTPIPLPPRVVAPTSVTQSIWTGISTFLFGRPTPPATPPPTPTPPPGGGGGTGGAGGTGGTGGGGGTGAGAPPGTPPPPGGRTGGAWGAAKGVYGFCTNGIIRFGVCAAGAYGIYWGGSNLWNNLWTSSTPPKDPSAPGSGKTPTATNKVPPTDLKKITIDAVRKVIGLPPVQTVPTGGRTGGTGGGGGGGGGAGGASPTGDGSSSGAGGGGGGGLGSIMGALGQMLGKLMGSPSPSPTTPPTPTTPTTPTSRETTPTIPADTASTTPDTKPRATLIANPETIPSGKTSLLTWSSINTSSCDLFAPEEVLLATGTRGSTSTPALATTTLFTLNCSAPSGATTSAQTTVTAH